MPKSDPIAAHWPAHRWDRPFFAGMLVAIWAAILSGFVYHNVKKYNAGQLSYPLIVHVHSLFFVGWLVLFTVQEILVQRDRIGLHRRLGMAGAWLAAGMVVLGVMTAIETERLKFGTPASDPMFMSVMFSDMIVFGGLVAAGIHWRKVPAAHKRLMLISTLLLTDAGFGRWLSPKIVEWMALKNYWELKTFAEGAWPFIRFQLLPAYSLVILLGAFDLVTRKRLHPVYLRAVPVTFAIHLFAGWLYFQPGWKATALQILGQTPK